MATSQINTFEQYLLSLIFSQRDQIQLELNMWLEMLMDLLLLVTASLTYTFFQSIMVNTNNFDFFSSSSNRLSYLTADKAVSDDGYLCHVVLRALHCRPFNGGADKGLGVVFRAIRFILGKRV